jgi:hypothetical protein
MVPEEAKAEVKVQEAGQAMVPEEEVQAGPTQVLPS